MKCPYCKNKMTAGSVSLEGTAGGFLLYGKSYKHCYFKPASDESESFKVLDNSETREANYCYNCDAVIIKHSSQ